MYVGEVVRRRGEPADLHVDLVADDARDHVVAETVDEVGRRLVLRVGGGEHLHDRDVALRGRLRRRGERHAFHAVVQRVAQLLERGDVLLTIRRGRGEQQWSVETGPEALGDEVVGTARGVAGGTVPGVVEPEAQRQQRHREQEEHGEPDEQRRPRVVLDHAAPPVPGGLATGRSRALVTTDLPLVDVAPGESEERGQERDRREHGGEHTGRDRDGHAAHDRRLHEPQAEHRDDHGGSREDHRAAGGVDGVHDAAFGVETGGEVLAVARDDEQRVVDPDAEADHCDGRGGEVGHVDEAAQTQHDRDTRADAEQRGADRQAHRDHGAEGDQQDDHRREETDGFGDAADRVRGEHVAAVVDLQTGHVDRVAQLFDLLAVGLERLVGAVGEVDLGVGDVGIVGPDLPGTFGRVGADDRHVGDGRLDLARRAPPWRSARPDPSRRCRP